MEFYSVDFFKSWILHSACFSLAKSFASGCNSEGQWGFLSRDEGRGSSQRYGLKDTSSQSPSRQLCEAEDPIPTSNLKGEPLPRTWLSSSSEPPAQNLQPRLAAQNPHTRMWEAVFESLWCVRRSGPLPRLRCSFLWNRFPFHRGWIAEHLDLCHRVEVTPNGATLLHPVLVTAPPKSQGF